ncbi:hypothetical protein ZWY2020_054802 [Hordeum vulgare]|nr:hypothetical protein ZWY2020_054802 [Hordeum vulgare]
MVWLLRLGRLRCVFRAVPLRLLPAYVQQQHGQQKDYDKDCEGQPCLLSLLAPTICVSCNLASALCFSLLHLCFLSTAVFIGCFYCL